MFKYVSRTVLTDVSKATAPLLLGQSTIFVVVTRRSECRDAGRLGLVGVWLKRLQFYLTQMSIKVYVQLLQLPADHRLAGALVYKQRKHVHRVKATVDI